MYNQREVVLIPVPFSDLSSQKNRPVVVLSNNEYNQKTEDVLVAGITTVVKNELYEIPLAEDMMEEGHLPMPSTIRCDKLYLLNNKTIRKKFGRIRKETLQEIRNKINQLIREN